MRPRLERWLSKYLNSLHKRDSSKSFVVSGSTLPFGINLQVFRVTLDNDTYRSTTTSPVSSGHTTATCEPCALFVGCIACGIVGFRLNYSNNIWHGITECNLNDVKAFKILWPVEPSVERGTDRLQLVIGDFFIGFRYASESFTRS